MSNRFLDAVQARRAEEQVADVRHQEPTPAPARPVKGRRIYEGPRERRAHYYEAARKAAAKTLGASARELRISIDMMTRIREELGLELHPRQPKQPPRPRHRANSAESVLSRRLREARLALDLTSEQIAAAVGVSRPTISAIERDATGIKATTLGRIAVRLGVSVDWLLGLSDCREVRP